MKKLLKIAIYAGVVALALFSSCKKEDSLTLEIPMKNIIFDMKYDSITPGEGNTTKLKLEHEYRFSDDNFLQKLNAYKNEPDISLEVWDKRFQVTKKIGDATGIADILLTASVDGVEIGNYSIGDTIEFAKAITDEAYVEFVDAFFKAVVDERKTVKVIFTGTLIGYSVPKADANKVLASYDFLQLMLARINIKR